MCVYYSRGGLNSDDLCARVLMSTSRHPCLFGRFAKDFSDRLMVAEQHYRRRSEGRWGIGRQVSPPSHRVGVPASLEPAGAGGSRLSDGNTGGSESQRDKDSTKTGHRLAVLFFPVGWEGGGKIRPCCGCSLPHQHTAAVTSGHPQRPVKEKRWTRCLIHRMFKSIVAIPLRLCCGHTCVHAGWRDPKEPQSR